MSWFDELGTNIGNALIAPQTFGSLMPAPTDPAQRQAMIWPALLSLGSSMMQSGRQGIGPLEAFGNAYSGLQQQGAQRSQQQLQSMQIMSKIGEQQKRNQTIEMLEGVKDLPTGIDPTMWKGMVRTDPVSAFKMYIEAQQAARRASAYGLGDTPGAPPPASGGPPPAPSGGVFDVPQQFGPQVRAAAQRYGVPPQLLASTFWNESRWNPNAINPNDQGPGIPSIGLGQWGQQWAQARGFDPRDPNASIDQTAQAMSEYAKRYGGNFMLARLAYGWGPGNVDKWLAAGGDPNKIPDGAKTWLPRTAFGIADDQQARAAFPQVAGMLRPGPVQMPWRDMGNQTAGVTAPNQPTASPSPVQPTQYTPPTPSSQPGGQPQSAEDPEIATLMRSRMQALRANDLDKIPAIDAAIAKRRGVLADRPYELERSQSQGRERAQIMRDAEVLKADVKDAAEYAQGIQNNALKARSTVANVQQLDALLDRVGTGRFTGSTVELKRIAKGLGINMDALGITDNVGTAEAARALSNQLTLQMRELAGGMPGAMSDPDRRFLEAMIPGLETSPEGRKLMIGYMKRMLEHSIGLALEISKYRQSPDWKTNPQGIIDVASRYGDQNRIFREEDIAAVARARGASPAPTSPIAEPQAAVPTPKPGDVMDGYRFKGGDPGKPGSWEKVR